VTDFQKLLRELPAVDRLLREPLLDDLATRLPRRVILQAVQETINLYRSSINEHKSDPLKLDQLNLSPLSMAMEAASLAEKRAGSSLKPLINATGIVIHTNLGRAPLAGSAVEALSAVAANYNNLELSLDDGKRGSRQEHLEALLCELSGAEAAITLNNNAAAVFLALKALTDGREVVVSRGQLVEIGGSFRIPEIMAASGAHLVEVGTTNKTYLRDYENALTENSAAFLKVHSSNYHMVGFTAEVNVADLAALAHKHNLLVIEDLGSGVLLDLEKYGLPAEPRVQDSIAAGVDLVTFSGDKMLGGPQAGIIVGRKELVARIRTNQLARALRVDKFTISALEATLRLYLDEERAISEIPVWRMLTVDNEALRKRAQNIANRFEETFGADAISIMQGISKVGGGALPTAELPTFLVGIKLQEGSPEALVEKLRAGDPPVILRLQQDTLLFDPRTIFVEQEDSLIEAIRTAYKG
jgi:L-seryl-tRNA(Ser) seleniumtransferase